MTKVSLFWILFFKFQGFVNFYFKEEQCKSYNPSVALDFLSAIIHKPEFWRCTDYKIIQDFNSDCIFSLNKEKLNRIVDFIQSEFNQLLTQSKRSINKYELKAIFKKRMLLIRHFLNNDKNSNQLYYIIDKLQNTRLVTNGDTP